MKSATFREVCRAIAQDSLRASEHAYDEAASDGLETDEIITATNREEVIEDYPADPRGPSCLVLVRIGKDAKPAHAVWGYDSQAGKAVLITVYRPDPQEWAEDFRTRRTRA